MAREVSRGDIWMYRFAPADRRRPVLVLSRQKVLDCLLTATVAPITSTIRDLPSEIRLGVDDGLKTECVANLDHVITVPQSELRRQLGHLDERRMLEVCAAINVALGCR